MKQREKVTPSSTREPLQMMKSSPITLTPMWTGAVLLPLMLPFLRREAPSILVYSETLTFLM